MGRLLGLGAAATAQVCVGMGDIEFLEECLAHLFVVVLSRVHQPEADVISLTLSVLYRMDNRRNLDEIGACAGYDGDVHDAVSNYGCIRYGIIWVEQFLWGVKEKWCFCSVKKTLL